MGRNAFYQHNYKTILYIVLGQIAVILTLLTMLLKLLDFTAARDYYFPMRENNEVIQELPLGEPLLTDAQIRDWAEEAVTHTLTFGYYDHLIRLQNSRAYFTTPGWADFTKALDEAKVLSTIGALGVEDASEQRKVVVTTLRPGTRAEIVEQGINGYRYEWHVKMTIDLSFYDTSSNIASHGRLICASCGFGPWPAASVSGFNSCWRKVLWNDSSGYSQACFRSAWQQDCRWWYSGFRGLCPPG
jgi:hypothetical protein